MRNTLFLCLSLLLSCSAGSPDFTDNTDDFLPVYTNPILQNDSIFTGAHWNDPHVLYENNQFVMYASSDTSWDAIVKIYRMISSDGVDWTLNPSTPVFEKSDSGWDDHNVETPAVVYYGGEYHLFYTGYDVDYDHNDNGDVAAMHFKIGHATSPDGINFTREGIVAEPTDPYGGVNMDFNQSVVGEPAPVVYDNKIYLYFTAVGAADEVGTTWQTIGLTTYDGSSWSTAKRVLTPDLAQYPRDVPGEPQNEYIGYSTPNAVVIGGRMHLYYDVVLNSPWQQVKLHHAFSANGETGWIQDSAPLYSREEFHWTSEEIRSPSALVVGSRLYLYYAGHNEWATLADINLGIGLAIREVP